jgi:hypothetical protein
MLNRKGGKVQALQAARIDGGYAFAVRVRISSGSFLAGLSWLDSFRGFFIEGPDWTSSKACKLELSRAEI